MLLGVVSVTPSKFEHRDPPQCSDGTVGPSRVARVRVDQCDAIANGYSTRAGPSVWMGRTMESVPVGSSAATT